MKEDWIKFLIDLKEEVANSGRTNFISKNFIENKFIEYNINLKELKDELKNPSERAKDAINRLKFRNNTQSF